MTAETSNARGEWVLVPWEPTEAMRTAHAMYADTSDWWQAVISAAPPPAAARGDVLYDRELIAEMLDVCGHPKFTLEAYMEQARLLREADNADAANVGTARLAAEGVQPEARGVVAVLRARLVEASAQYSPTSGVGAGIDRAIDELDAIVAQEPLGADEIYVRDGTGNYVLCDLQETTFDELPLYCARMAGRIDEQPEARGVVRHDLCDCPNGRAEHSPSCAALTGERNG